MTTASATCCLMKLSKYLEEEEMRRLIARFKERADNETDEFNKRHWLIPVETLASHLNDPVVYEESRLAMFDGEPGTAACLDIGAEYLKAGDREKALDWIEKVPTTESFMAHERDALLVRLLRRSRQSGQTRSRGMAHFPASPVC